MIVSEAHGFVWFHNPKAAGTSFRQSIGQYHDWGRSYWGEEYSQYFGFPVDLAHLRAWELPAVTPHLFSRLSDFRTLTFIRNRARRFVSACFEHYRKFQPEVNFIGKSIEEQRSGVLAIVRRLTREMAMCDYRHVHFALQRHYVFLGTARLTNHVVPVLTENDDLHAAYDILGIQRATVGRHNLSRPEVFHQIITPEVLDFVKKFYETDFEMVHEIPELNGLISHEAA